MSSGECVLTLRMAAGAALAAALILIVPRPAAACDCSCGVAVLRWPRDGATGVSTDTPVVVELLDCGSPDMHIEFALSTADGTKVALKETLRLPPPARLCEGETLFLRPEAALDPDATYVFSQVGYWNPDADFGATFKTGHTTFVPEPPVDPDITYFRATFASFCTAPFCSGLADPSIDLRRPPMRPRWATVTSDAPELGSNRFTFFPVTRPGPEPVHAWQIPVALPPGDDCIDVRVYGVEGRALFTESLCRPDACAVIGLLGVNDCDDVPSTRVDPTRLPPGSCDDPPVLDHEPGVGLVYPNETGGDGDSGAVDATDAKMPSYADGGSADTPSPGDGGCTVTHPRAARAPAAWFRLLAVALGAAFVLRRRSRHRRA